MNDEITLISGIEYKVRKLLELKEKDNRKIKVLSDQNLKLDEQIEEQKSYINKLKEQIKKIKIAKSLENSDGSVEAKLKINELVREIDKCIGLLNN
jgi:predicted RNase H-like nuclease (RuvC/YqgF family)